MVTGGPVHRNDQSYILRSLALLPSTHNTLRNRTTLPEINLSTTLWSIQVKHLAPLSCFEPSAGYTRSLTPGRVISISCRNSAVSFPRHSCRRGEREIEGTPRAIDNMQCARFGHFLSCRGTGRDRGKAWEGGRRYDSHACVRSNKSFLTTLSLASRPSPCSLHVQSPILGRLDVLQHHFPGHSSGDTTY